MSSGLESIAMAVAHLERMQQQQQEQQQVPKQKVPPQDEAGARAPASPTSYIPPSTPLRERNSRIVSVDNSADGMQVLPAKPGMNNSNSNNLVSYAVGDRATTFTSTAAFGAPAVILSSPASSGGHMLNDRMPSSCREEHSDLHEQPKKKLERKQQLKNLDAVFQPADLSPSDPVPDPREAIHSVLDDDVLCGRGGETNHHPGNIQYRMLVKACQPAYLAAKRRDKPRIAAGIVLAVRKVGGRFLKKDANANSWRDVGNNRAREKTSQALREGAPELRTAAEEPTVQPALQQPAPPVHAPSVLVPMNRPPVMLLPKNHHPGAMNHHHNHHLMMVRSEQVPPPHAIDAALVMGNMLDGQRHQPLQKKQRQALNHMAEATSRPMPMYHQGFMPHHWGAIKAFVDANQPRPPQPPQVQQHDAGAGVAQPAPAAFVATVSGDDDDSASSSSTSSSALQNKKEVRGPRIKLLKRRLEEQT